MNLIIDVGNSFIKIAVFKGNTLIVVEKTIEDDFLKNVSKFFNDYLGIEEIAVSSVGKLLKDHIRALSVFAPVTVLTSASKVPFKNEYATPETLGVDRIALVAAAFYRYKMKNCLVIDAGSCITYDFIDRNGVYKGGAIAPGLRMRYRAMHEFTENLPLIDSFEWGNFIGNTTKDCMVSGVLNGSVNEMDAVIAQYREKFKDLTVILTGGDSHFLSKRLKSSIFAHPNFLLEGINHILELNKH
ncbi:type III pantothenate kinase [Galbibacter sp. EGI 63066]|uniref:type III pantothenate kinase n=1 Tax=Galbibacter sp. EGI 63066 TaxID=2993559 RepID=UPI0022492AFF|nr:type III pantothenate kinase [Galbibacter sp. EGI 63066]MCX2679944.1 type III pantothenate kinase [Galbibacter sp. EGI 63066]